MSPTFPKEGRAVSNYEFKFPHARNPNRVMDLKRIHVTDITAQKTRLEEDRSSVPMALGDILVHAPPL
jgi:hypothetical protein